MKIIIGIFLAIVAILWGWFSPSLLPVETYGVLCFIISGIGGGILGYIYYLLTEDM